MNTNGNAYTIIYSTIIVVIVAAVLAFASMSLQPKQDANVKAETISQMLTAAHFFTKEELDKMGNDKVLSEYTKYIEKAYTINANGEVVRELSTSKNNIELADDLKEQNKLIKENSDNYELPVYVFNKDGKKVTVVPVYGAGLWGAVWEYIAFDEDYKTIIGAYFDHESETPGLGAKIKDDPSFRARFEGKIADFTSDEVFAIVKGGVTDNRQNAIDAITGATMTSKGLGNAIETWLEEYKPLFLEKMNKADTNTILPADSIMLYKEKVEE